MMKKILFLFALLAMLTIHSCRKEELLEVTVIRDCTGTYLRFNSEDFRVCNSESLLSYTHGQKIRADFKTLSSDCPPQGIVCLMYHEFKENVEVLRVE